MEGTMKTAVMLGIGKMGFEEREIPKAKDNEVLVKLEYVDRSYRRLCSKTALCTRT